MTTTFCMTETKDEKNNKIVLVAEDDYSSYKLLSIYITKNGAEVLWAKNGLEAVEICSQNREICLVFMDINMPVMDGFDATKKIKELRNDLPVIIQTAYNDNETKCYEAGCDDFIVKPLNMKIIFDMMNKYIREYNHGNE